jgi:hypothetical protein
MEREKRLELDGADSQAPAGPALPVEGKSSVSQTDTPTLQTAPEDTLLRLDATRSVSSREIAALIQAHPDLLEIAATWQQLNPTIKEPIMTMMRGARIRM